MKSINSLIQQINIKEDPSKKREFDTYKQLDDNIIELLNKIRNIEKTNMMYHVECGKSIAEAYANAAIIDWDVTDYPQFGNMHSNTVRNTDIFIRRNGVYTISVGLWMNALNSGTQRGFTVRRIRNGVASFIDRSFVGFHNTALCLNTCRTTYCYEHDYIQVQINHDAAGNVTVSADHRTFFAVTERMEELSPEEYGLLDPNANMR